MAYLCSLIFIFAFCDCLGSKDFSDGKNYEGYRNYERVKYFSIVGSDYNEDKEDIWRPCLSNDYGCMSHFLSSNSKCTPAHGSTPDPIKIPVEKVYLPGVAMTITHVDAEVRGFRNAKINEFFVNNATRNLVIAVTVPTYNFSANGFFTYQRDAKEPIILNDFNTYELDELVLTATIPKFYDLRLDLADIHTNTSKGPVRFYVGPGAYKSNDPAVKLGMANFVANVQQVTREALLVLSYLFMSTFIQNELCDFGLDSSENFNGYYLLRRGNYKDYI